MIPLWSAAELSKVIQAVNQLIRGGTNASGTVTLAANATTTTITSENINSRTRLILFPATANAAAELGAGTMYVSAVVSGLSPAQGTATITHANNAQTDRTFNWFAPFGD